MNIAHSQLPISLSTEPPLVHRGRYTPNPQGGSRYDSLEERRHAYTKQTQAVHQLTQHRNNYGNSSGYGALLGGAYLLLIQGLDLVLRGAKQETKTVADKIGKLASKTVEGLILGFFFGGALYIVLHGQEWGKAWKDATGKTSLLESWK